MLIWYTEGATIMALVSHRIHVSAQMDGVVLTAAIRHARKIATIMATARSLIRAPVSEAGLATTAAFLCALRTV